MEYEVYQRMYQLQGRYWWFSGQRFLINALLKKFSPRQVAKKILDAGCGPGANLPLLQQHGWTVGLDFSKTALRLCLRQGHSLLCQATLLQLPFKDNSFDIATVIDVLYHRKVGDDLGALHELNRILKNNGLIILREPAFNILKRKHDIVEQTLRRYTRKEFKQKVEESGFFVQDIFYEQVILFPLVLLIKLKERFFEPRENLNSDLFYVPRVINKILTSLLKIEVFLEQKIRMPFGVGIVCVAVKL